MSTALPPACDRPIAECSAVARAATGAAPTHPGFVLATTIFASSLAFIDGSVINVGLPAIGRDLGAAGAGLSWVVNGYLLPLTALLLLGGACGDRFGRRRLLIIGVGLFALSSLLCALAPNLVVLVLGRVAQGVGAALLMPNSLAILGVSFTGAARGRAVGIWAAIAAAAGAVGPLIGGLLIDLVGWRAIFLINLPIAAAAVFMAIRYLEDLPHPSGQRLDVAGAALASVGLGCLTWGVTSASDDGDGLRVAASAAIVLGLAVLFWFVLLEKRRGDAAMLPSAMFASRRFVSLNLMTFLLYGALGATLVLLPFCLIEAGAYSATQAGAALLPLPLIIAATSSTMGRIAAVSGPRLPLTLGSVLAGAGFFLCIRIGPHTPYLTTVLPAMLMIAIGMAGAVAPLTTAVLSAVDVGHTGVASGFNSAVARGGGMIAVAVMGHVFSLHGTALIAGFHWCALVSGGAALAAAASAYAGLKGPAATSA